MADFDTRTQVVGPDERRADSSGSLHDTRYGGGEAGGGSSDSTPPTVTVLSPAEGSAIELGTELIVRVDDETKLAKVVLYAEYPTLQHAEVVHNGDAFLQPYATLSTKTVLVVDASFRFNLRRDGGWPGDVNLTAIGVDTSGNTIDP